ncbi:MAG TPA: sugar ABC transporter substrate-binding protein [Clostridiaceae bacterium]|nr:sugar ABC transporter substrate-binding protein [Clostridiaceae bacterium]
MRKGLKALSMVLALVMMIAVVLTGCGNQAKPAGETKSPSAEPSKSPETSAEAPKEVTVRFGLWGSDKEITTYTEVSKGIEEMFPGLKLEMQPYPSSADFWNQLPAQIAAKTAPDIVKLTNEGSYEYIEKGMFAPIDDLIKEANLDLSAYADSAKQIWAAGGKQYGIPVSVVPAMFIINKDMWDAAGLKEYPKTWAEVKEAAKALTKDDVKGICINIMEFHFTQYALSYGGGWGYGKTINSDANVKALETIVDMFESGVAISPQEAGFGWDGEVFANKKAAMSTGGYWYKGFLSESAPDINYVVIGMPEGTTKGCTSHSDGWVVLKDAPDKVAAVKAAYYLTRDEALEKIMTEVGINPSKPALSAKYYEVNPEFKAIEAMVPYAKDFGYPADTKKFIDTLIPAMQEKILAGSSKSVKEILDEVQAKFN